MGTVTIRPDSTVAAGSGGNIFGGAPTAHQAVNDSNDATYVSQGVANFAPDPTAWMYTLGDPTIPAGRFPWRVRMVHRWQDPLTGGTSKASFLALHDGTANRHQAVGVGYQTGPHTTQTAFAWIYNPYQGGYWDQTKLNALRLDWDMAASSLTGGMQSLNLLEVWVEVEYTELPISPTAISPASGATVTTDTPLLTATLATHPSGSTIKQKLEWQIASDTGFTTNLKTITESSAFLRAAGTPATISVTPANQLTQGTWYVRVRALDEMGTVGAWSATNNFTVAHAPTTTGHSPTSNQTRDYSGTGNTLLSWIFQDTSPTDVQTAYQVVIERNDTGVGVVDTGKITTGVASYVATIASGLKDVVLRWKVRVWDSDDVVGPYSNLQLFTISDAPTLTITSPAAAAVVANPAPLITWTFVASNGRTQSNYSVILTRTSDGVVIYNSGTIAGTATSHQVPQPVMFTGLAYSVTVTVNDSAGLTKTTTNNFTTSWSLPTTPSTQAVSTTAYNTIGYVRVTWNATIRDPDFYSWRVYRKKGVAGVETLLNEILVPATGTYDDYSAEAAADWYYTVVQVANRFGSLVESARSYVGPISLVSDNYWLIHLTDSSKNLKLTNVTDDSYTDEYEEETLNLIGRGRKTDYGTHFGITGTLTCKFRGDGAITARDQRINLLNRKAERAQYILRTPFGDNYLISMGDISVGRMAGVGQQEFVDVTIPYREVT